MDKWNQLSVSNEELEIVCNSIIEYFNFFLPSTLLYLSEQSSVKAFLQQYSDKDYSELFGIDHLLRLLCMRFESEYTNRCISLLCISYGY